MTMRILHKGNAVADENELAFRQLFTEYYPSLVSFAMHYVEKSAVAEDLVQDVFVKIWETQEKLKTVEDLSAYIYQMVRFKCLNYLRNEKVRTDATQFFTDDLAATELNAFLKEETFRVVSKAMDNLPPACSRIFAMTLEGYAAKDIAAELGIAVETVKKQKQIARRMLKEKLGRFSILFFLISSRRWPLPLTKCPSLQLAIDKHLQNRPL